MRMSFLCGLAAVAVLCLATPGRSQQTVEEPSTKVQFPAQITLTYHDTTDTLVVTGMAVRKKLFFKGYAIASYMQDPPHGTKEQVFAAILRDGKAKELIMHFVRDVDEKTIQNSWRDGFKKNANQEEQAELQPLLEQFVGYFPEKVFKGQEYIFRWFPGGVVQTNVKGEERPTITNVLFARTLWLIWFGDHSVVNRDDLIERLITKS